MHTIFSLKDLGCDDQLSKPMLGSVQLLMHKHNYKLAVYPKVYH